MVHELEGEGEGAGETSVSAPASGGRFRPWVAALTVFLVTAPLLWAFYSRHPLLYDTDSSYHLALARATGDAHLRLHEFPAVRMSALTAYGFADATWLFHVVLAPFSSAADVPGGDLLAGGRLALALFDALLLASIAGLACRAVGAWGLLAPLWIALGSLETAWRMVRLRPELLSLLLLLLALAAAARGRYRWLGLLAALYSLAYVAWHAFLGLFVLLFVFRIWVRRRWDWPLLLYPLLGTGFGLVVHPNFPSNLLLWKLVAFDFFRFKGVLDVGTETGPAPLSVMLLANLGFWATALLLWRARTARPSDGAAARADWIPWVDAFGLATFCFTALYLMMERFALYAFPFAALWLLYVLALRGETIGRSVRLPFRGTLPVPLAFGVLLVVLVPGLSQERSRFAQRTDPGPNAVRLTDRAAFARALPAGATVASPWGDTSTYLLWAPQGRYLNVLDPVAMAVPFPQAYAAQRALFDGSEPDVPLAAVSRLDSRFVAWSLPGSPPRLLARMRDDPRVHPLHLGIQALFALEPAPPGTFVLDWRANPVEVDPRKAAHESPSVADLALPSASASAAWPLYPLEAGGAAAAFEGFVDGSRIAPGRCVAFTRPASDLAPGTYELAAAGPTSLWLGEERRVAIGGAPGAVLGEGVRFALSADVPAPASTAGDRLTVLTCPGEGGRTGFYLLPRR